MKKSYAYLVFLFFFILFDEVCNSYLFQNFNRQEASGAFWLMLTFLGLQVLAAPIQAGFSDRFCRKSSLVVSLLFTIISLISMSVFNSNINGSVVLIVFASLFKAGLGNTLPISWAAIADTHTKKRNFRFSLGLSTSAIAIAYLVLQIIDSLFSEVLTGAALVLVFFILFVFCVFFFKDIRDMDLQTPKTFVTVLQELKLIWLESKSPSNRNALISFFLWQLSFYSVNIFDIDLESKSFQHLTTTMMVGYLLGIFVLRYCSRVSDFKLIRLGYLICVSSVFVFVFVYYFVESRSLLMLISFFFYNFGTAFMPASLFAVLSKDRKPHEQGKIYGFIDSMNTLGFLVATILAKVYNLVSANQFSIGLFCFLIFLISWVPYQKFERWEHAKMHR